MQLMARLASLIPPPRYPLQRAAGVFAPGSAWRADVVVFGRAAPRAEPVPATKPKRNKKKKSEPKTSHAPKAGSTPRAPRTAGLSELVSGRVPWADLLRRIYLEDVLACPCGGRRRVVANIDDPAVVAAILAHLGLPTQAPPIARARSPSFDAA
jgi:hypothetical protein